MRLTFVYRLFGAQVKEHFEYLEHFKSLSRRHVINAALHRHIDALRSGSRNVSHGIYPDGHPERN